MTSDGGEDRPDAPGDAAGPVPAPPPWWTDADASPSAPPPSDPPPSDAPPVVAEPSLPSPPLTDAAPPAVAVAPAPALDDPSKGFLAVLRDNVEAVAFALILALLLRHCAIEVFKIPTSSMEPTLFGDNSDTHPDTPGDRILVDKSAYVGRDPARWDVLVFRYPLDWARAFIKRCVGLPGEALRIERGDVWVGPADATPDALHPARKPRNVREQLYFRVYPPAGPRAQERPADWWTPKSTTPGSVDVPAHGRVVLDPGAGGGTATAEYAFAIRDTDRATSDPRLSSLDWFFVSDVRVRATVRAAGPASVTLSWSPGDGRLHRLTVASEGAGPSEATTSGRRVPLTARLVPGRDLDVELESVDGDLRAWVDGHEVAVLADEVPVAEAVRIEGLGEGGTRPTLDLSARGARVELSGVAVDRDLYYTNYRSTLENRPSAGDVLRTGDDEYFMLGDNTRKSSDSRRWVATGVRLKDGTEVLWDWQTLAKHSVVDGQAWREVVDVEGVTRRWRTEDEAPDGALSERRPFVRRDRIVGRAWFALVFWPLDQLLPRVRFIR